MIICSVLIKPVGAQTNQTFLQIIQSPIRLEQDFKLDSKRKPLEMLQFIAAKPGSQVLDILSGGERIYPRHTHPLVSWALNLR
jgi:predicted methyltransferase